MLQLSGLVEGETSTAEHKEAIVTEGEQVYQ